MEIVVFNRKDPPQLPNGRRWEGMFFGYTILTETRPTYLEYEDARRSSLVGSETYFKQVNWDPTKPYRGPGKHLFRAIKQMLAPNLSSLLHMYPTIGTSFDTYHGIDGCFILRDESIPLEEHLPVTFDLTTRDKPGCTANILIKEENFNQDIIPRARIISSQCWRNLNSLHRLKSQTS